MPKIRIHRATRSPINRRYKNQSITMVKNLNMFTGKVDIIADASDSKQAIELERYKLGKDAGRVIKTRSQAQPPAPKDRAQITMF